MRSPAMWRKFVDNHLDTYKMLMELGCEPTALWMLPGHSKRRAHYFTGMGPAVLKALEKGARGHGVKIMFNHKAVQLVVDSVKKRVI